jgi:hypothetical protein
MIKLKSLLLEDVYEYFYHATTTDNLPNIFLKGLLPSENPHWGGDLGKQSYGKVFVSKIFRAANYYGNILWRNEPEKYKPILRFKYNKLRFIPDKHSTNDFYIQYPIKTHFDIFVYNDDTKIKVERNGDTWFDEKTGFWRKLTKELSDVISSGEWDKDFINELEYPLAKGKDLQSYGDMEGWKGKLVWMSPEKFLSLVSNLPDYLQNKKSMKNLEYRMKNNLPIDFLVLEVDMVKRKIIGHEGRHRAKTALKLGIEKVPVLIHTGNCFDRVPDWTPDTHDIVDKLKFKPEYDKS